MLPGITTCLTEVLQRIFVLFHRSKATRLSTHATTDTVGCRLRGLASHRLTGHVVGSQISHFPRTYCLILLMGVFTDMNGNFPMSHRPYPILNQPFCPHFVPQLFLQIQYLPLSS